MHKTGPRAVHESKAPGITGGSSHEGYRLLLDGFGRRLPGRYSGEKKVFSGERKVFSGERKIFSGERKVFSGERKAFSGDRKVFSGERKVFSGERKVFSGERVAYSDSFEASGRRRCDI
jgi:hypothetical protein